MVESAVFAAMNRTTAPDDLIDLLSTFVARYGFGALCFVIPSFDDPDHFQVMQKGLPEHWIKQYLDGDFGLVDPVPEYTIRSGEVNTLYYILQDVPASEKQVAYMAEFYRSGMTDGLALPTCGHNGRGFLGLTEVTDADLKKADHAFLHAVAQFAHWRMDRLRKSMGAQIAHLSSRETEILKWLSAGKSNPDIATILGISPATVATHLTRLFMKMGVNDRVSAALKGYKLGFLD